MFGLPGLFVLGTSIWMAVDASNLGYDKRDVKGIAAMGPGGWFICGLLLWIVAFPLYLIKRPELAAAGARRRAMLAGQAPSYLPPPAPLSSYVPPPGFPQVGFGAMPPAPAAPPPTPLSADEVAERLFKLDELRIAGLLTDAEFEQQKAILLARLS